MERQPRSEDTEGLRGPCEEEGPSPLPGRIGAYQVEGRLGCGGMGEVFLAWDGRLERRVTIKRIRQDSRLSSEQRERFAARPGWPPV